jgi:signal transduction histidine kinase
VVITALRSPTGELTGFAKVTRDLTDRREAAERERQLLVEREARAKAEEAIRQRDRFLSIASHELKTPVASLQIVTEALLRSQRIGTLNGERLAASLGRIDRASQRLASLLAELLDVSRLANGQDLLAVERIDLSEVLQDVVERFQPIEGRTRVLLIAEPMTIYGDAIRLDQVFANLIDNALKYSPESEEVRVALRRIKSGVEVSVHDVGIGLSMPAHQELFEPFGRGTNVEEVPGLGLGLFIARQIVERHGGTISAQSDGPGRGSVFQVRLPFRPPPPKAHD